MLAVDLAEAMLERLCAIHGCGGPLGNEPGVRPWLGDVESVPAYQVLGSREACPMRASDLPVVPSVPQPLFG